MMLNDMVKRYFILLVALLLYVVTQAQERVWNSAFLKNESPHTLYSFQAGMSWMKFDDTFGVKGKLAVGVCSFTDEPAGFKAVTHLVMLKLQKPDIKRLDRR